MRKRGKFNIVKKLIFLVIFSVLRMSYSQTTPEFLFNESHLKEKNKITYWPMAYLKRLK